MVQMLKLVGAGGHYPTNKLQLDEEDASSTNITQPSLISSSLENLKGRAEALAETSLFAFYKVCLCSRGQVIVLTEQKHVNSMDALHPAVICIV